MMDKTTKEALTGKGKELSTEALEKRKAMNKKIIKFGCLPILLLLILIAIIPKGGSDDAKKADATTAVEESNKHISGLAPADMYLNLEKKGFQTKKELGGEYGNSWTSTQSYEGMDLMVETFSFDTETVITISATAMVDVSIKKIEASKQFMKYIATMPYDNAKPEEAAKWVDENFNNDKASTVISGVRFTMYAPSGAARMLNIEKAENN